MKYFLAIVCLLALLFLSACCPPPVSAGAKIITQFYAPTEPSIDISSADPLPALPPLQDSCDTAA